MSPAGESRTNEEQEPHLRAAGRSRTPYARALHVSPSQAQVVHRICLAHTLAEVVVPSHVPRESPNRQGSSFRRRAILCHMDVHRAQDDAQDLQGMDRSTEAMRGGAGTGQGYYLQQAEGATACGKMHQIVAPAGPHPSCQVCDRHYTYRAQADTGDACRCDLSGVADRQQRGGCQALQGTVCESVVRICAEGRERWTEHEEGTQMGVEPAHDQGETSLGSCLLDGHDRRNAVHGREGLTARDEWIPPVDCCGHQAGQSYQ